MTRRDRATPSMRLGRALRIGTGLALGAAYVAACQWLMTSAPPSPWNVVGVLAPMLALVAAGCWGRGQRVLAGLALAALGVLGAEAWAGIALRPERLYLAQHVGANLALAAGFASTLRPGRTALITLLARRIHRVFTPAMAAYTRRCTVAWVLYFLAVAALSLGLYAYAPFDLWALYANVLAPITIAAMFVGEYLLRYRLHPDFERITLADAIRSYRERASG